MQRRQSDAETKAKIVIQGLQGGPAAEQNIHFGGIGGVGRICISWSRSRSIRSVGCG